MDDHMYDRTLDYAECELIPRFREEFKKYGKLKDCPSYEEIKDFCKIMTLIEKWDYTRRIKHVWKPSELLDYD